MALPPPLPSLRLPPPLPFGRGGPPPLPGSRLPPLLPSQRTNTDQFDPTGEYKSDRENQFNIKRSYVDGTWISVNSTWLNRIMFKSKQEVNISGEVKQAEYGDMYVEFLSLALCMYPNTPRSDFVDLLNSSSKGRWTYYEAKLKHRRYTLLRQAQRKVTSAMKLKREPITQFGKKRTYRVRGKVTVI